jgi:hypothetical protein
MTEQLLLHMTRMDTSLPVTLDIEMVSTTSLTAELRWTSLNPVGTRSQPLMSKENV